ncbi:MAG TPA: YceD family protein [Burkholderiales bacterium]
MLQPAAIDGLAFARNAAVLKGRLGMESLPRLAQSGCSGSVLDFVLTGEINERGKPGLKLAVDGSVRLECQRCLGSLEFPLHIEAQLEFALSEAEIMAADDDIERVMASRELSVAALVEDEVLLALPMVPKHEQCNAAAGLGAEAKPSAFQALAALRKRSFSKG